MIAADRGARPQRGLASRWPEGFCQQFALFASKPRCVDISRLSINNGDSDCEANRADRSIRLKFIIGLKENSYGIIQLLRVRYLDLRASVILKLTKIALYLLLVNSTCIVQTKVGWIVTVPVQIVLSYEPWSYRE